MSSRIYGVDLGTTFTTAAWVDENDTLRALPNLEDRESKAKVLESIAYFSAQGEVMVGAEARKKLIREKNKPDTNFVTGAKRYLGLPIPEATPSGDPLPCIPPYFAFGVAYSPVEISALVLKKLKAMVTSQEPDHPLERIVLTHPHYFSEPQKAATRLAAELAGLEVAEMMTEPAAAALACLHGTESEDQRVVVFDLGGGTLDITLFEIAGGQFQWKGGAGDAFLGGRDFDTVLLRSVVEEWNQRSGLQFADTTSLNLSAKADKAIQQAKMRLQLRESETDEIILHVEGGDQGSEDGSPITVDNIRIDRKRFENTVQGLVRKAQLCLEKALREARPAWNSADVGRVAVVGGSGRLLPIQKCLREMGFDLKLHPEMDAAVAMGAALRGAALAAGQVVPSPVKTRAPEVKKKGPVSGVRLAVSNVPAPLLAYSVGIKTFDPASRQDVVFALADKGDPMDKPLGEREFETTEDDARELEIELYEFDPHLFPRGYPPLDNCRHQRIGAVRLPVARGPKGQKVHVRLRFESSGVVVVDVRDPLTGKVSSAPIDRGLSRASEQGLQESATSFEEYHLDSVTHMRERLAALRVK